MFGEVNCGCCGGGFRNLKILPLGILRLFPLQKWKAESKKKKHFATMTEVSQY